MKERGSTGQPVNTDKKYRPATFSGKRWHPVKARQERRRLAPVPTVQTFAEKVRVMFRRASR